MEPDYSKLGLKCGIEIHQQLDARKLFCNCPSVIREEEPHFTIRRKLRAVAGELGDVDPAALYEFLKDQEFVYEVYNDTNCLVETDCEPPGPLNKEALSIAIEVAMMLNARIVDEVQVMRKTVIDGSNTSGFQRTCLVAVDGFVEVGGRKIGVPTICLEEDAARIIKKEGNTTTYRLDRLGIPLIEIGTDPDIKSPEEAKACAERIGMILRATGKVKRGLGTIRQDLNVSIRDGRRIEIKGVQTLKDIPGLIRNEAMRQARLLEIKKLLISRRVKKADIKSECLDVKKAFEGSSSKLVASTPGIFGIRLKGFAGILGTELMPQYRFGTELAGIARSMGLRGILHGDELPAYGISKSEVEIVREILNVADGDNFVLVIAEKEKAQLLLDTIAARCRSALDGIPKEVRRAEGEITVFMRPMPGSARMYPETDELPVRIDEKLLMHIKPAKMPEEEMVELLKMGLSAELANQLIRSPELAEFKGLVEELRTVKPSVIANVLMSRPKGVGIDLLREVLKLLAENRIAKESVLTILEELAGGKKDALAVAKERGLLLMGKKELEERISSILRVNQELARKKMIGPLMGRLMAELRGKADVEEIQKILKEKLE